MELLADENAESEWITALQADGHDVERVVDVEALGLSTTDEEVLAFAARTDRVLLTADQSDFSEPPLSDHAGIIIVTDGTIPGGDLRTAIARIEDAYPALRRAVTYASDWL